MNVDQRSSWLLFQQPGQPLVAKSLCLAFSGLETPRQKLFRAWALQETGSSPQSHGEGHRRRRPCRWRRMNMATCSEDSKPWLHPSATSKTGLQVIFWNAVRQHQCCDASLMPVFHKDGALLGTVCVCVCVCGTTTGHKGKMSTREPPLHQPNVMSRCPGHQQGHQSERPRHGAFGPEPKIEEMIVMQMHIWSMLKDLVSAPKNLRTDSLPYRCSVSMDLLDLCSQGIHRQC